jgi:hypothetical protein
LGAQREQLLVKGAFEPDDLGLQLAAARDVGLSLLSKCRHDLFERLECEQQFELAVLADAEQFSYAGKFCVKCAEFARVRGRRGESTCEVALSCAKPLCLGGGGGVRALDRVEFTLGLLEGLEQGS